MEACDSTRKFSHYHTCLSTSIWVIHRHLSRLPSAESNKEALQEIAAHKGCHGARAVFLPMEKNANSSGVVKVLTCGVDDGLMYVWEMKNDQQSSA
jgi:hypothetical protein